MDKSPKIESAGSGSEKGFDRDAAYEAANNKAVELIMSELNKAKESGETLKDIEPLQIIENACRTIVPEGSDNEIVLSAEDYRTLEELSEMRVLVEIDKGRYEKATLHPRAAELVGHLYDIMK